MTYMIPIHSHSNNVLHILYSCTGMIPVLPAACSTLPHSFETTHTRAHDYYYCCFSYLVTVVHSSFVVVLVVYSLAHVPP
jgi:hypothetical protein